MVCTVSSLGLQGVQGYGVDVECSLSSGLPDSMWWACRRGGEGGPGAGPRRHQELRLRLSRVPDHGEPGPRRPQKGGDGV